jgi:plastocyanin
MSRLPLAFALAAAGLAVAPAAAGSGVTISAVDNAFRPSSVTVAPGTRVTWHNAGKAPHDVTGSGFASGNLDPGKSYAWTAAKAGTYAYICRYHSGLGMKGTIVVRSASGLPKTGGDHVALGLLVLGAAGAAGLSLRYGWRLR